MATWKKVHVNGANTTHGTITANLGAAGNDIDDSNLSHNIVVSATDGTSSGALTVAEVTFGTAAFDAATSFATAAQGTLADTAVQPGDFLKDLVTGAGLSGGVDNLLYGTDSDVTLAVDIAGATDLGTGVAGADSILVADATDSNNVKRCTLSQAIAAVSSGVTSFTAGTNLTEDGGDTTGALVVNLDANLVDMASMSADHIAAGVTDGAGNDLTFNGGQGTGTGIGGDILFKVANVAGTSANTVNALATALTIAAPTSSTGNSTVTVAGDLVVSGTTTTVNTTNLEVLDQFILLNNAAVATDADAGIVVEGASKTVAFGYDQSADRFAFDKTGASSSMTSIGNDAYFVHAHTASGAAGQDSDFAQYGNIYVDSATQDIYIYS